MLEAVILGVVQGLTEFLPVSSTAHLVILPWFFKWGGGVDSLSFDVALHAGTFASLLVCFRKDIVEMLFGRRRLLLLILAGSVPAGAAGIMFRRLIEDSLRTPQVIAAMLVLFGLVMLAAERLSKGSKGRKVTFWDAIFIGAAQAVALVPGVSRSGITISAGLLRGLKRQEAARFSFLLSMPAVGGAALLEGREILTGGGDAGLALVAAGFMASMASGIAAIKFLLKYLSGHPMDAFVYYRFALAALIVGGLLLRG